MKAEANTLCYIGLGSNLGDSREIIRQALKSLGETPGIRVLAAAPLYKTAPWGHEKQDFFINTVVRVDTTLTPRQLLAALQQIEAAFGRKRVIHWGPRTLDLDILLYGELKVNEPDLQIPHPLISQRAFVMCPLADLAPELIIGGKKAAVLAAGLALKQEIKILEDSKMQKLVLKQTERKDLSKLLGLLAYLHDDSSPKVIDAGIEEIWSGITQDPNHHVLLGYLGEIAVSSCVIVIIQNLTRNQRPYAIIENVITHPDHRNKGYASMILAAHPWLGSPRRHRTPRKERVR